MMSEVTVAPGHDATVLKEMIVAAAVEEIDRGEIMTQATVVETMIVAAARQNENAVAASDEMMMMTSTLETAGKDGKMKVTMTTDEAAGVRTTNKDSYDGRGGDNERDDCNERGGGKDDERDEIMAALSEMTQEMAVAVADAKLEDGRRCENGADEQALLEQLLQGNGME